MDSSHSAALAATTTDGGGNSILVSQSIDASPADSSATTAATPIDDPRQNLTQAINSIQKTLGILHQLYLTVSSYNVASQLPLLQRMNNLVLELDNMTRLAEKCNIQVPMEVLNLIDDGKNPDEFTRDMLNGCIAKNQITKGKTDAFKSLRKHLLEELEQAFPGEVETYREIRAASAADKETDIMFQFDKVFYPGSEQDDVYKFLASNILSDFTNGVDRAIITCGQTGAGKTCSMEGPSINGGNVKQKGLLPRVVDSLFNNINDGTTIKLSMVEIYMERVSASKKNLQIKEDKTHGVFVDGVTEMQIKNSAEALNNMQTGIENRAVEGTQINTTRILGHCIYTFTIESNIRLGKLILVDLASENTVRTEAEGSELKEVSLSIVYCQQLGM